MTPTSKLEVAGNVEAQGFTLNGVPVGRSTDTYWSANPGNIYYSSGNVGIGTTSPTEKLDVEGHVLASGGFIAGNTTYYEDGYIANDGI